MANDKRKGRTMVFVNDKWEEAGSVGQNVSELSALSKSFKQSLNWKNQQNKSLKESMNILIPRVGMHISLNLQNLSPLSNVI